MKNREFGSSFVVRIDKGEEIVDSLKNFCRENGIKLGLISGIGAAENVVLGYFELASQKYFSHDHPESHEITSLLGNITQKDGEVYLHLHATIADKEGRIYGGHLTRAVVSATFEGIINVIDGQVERKLDDATGLNLLDID